MRIEKDFKEFFALLNKNRVKYLIVGGFAFSYYAHPRFTKDIDVFVEMSQANAENIVNTLIDFGFRGSTIKKEFFLQPQKIIQLGFPPMRIDIITSISGIEFGEAWDNRVLGEYGDVPCFFISKSDLMKNKKAAGRPQDIADLKMLRKQ